jgi:hypothetical protein
MRASECKRIGRHPSRTWIGLAVLANWLAGGHAEMVFVADDFAAWLIGVLADAGRQEAD